MTKSNLKDKNLGELEKSLIEKREELRKLRFNVAGTKGLKSNAAALRKDVARIMTELKERSK